MLERDGACWQIQSIKYDGTLHRTWTCAYPLQSHPMYRGEFYPYYMLLIPAHTKVQEADGGSWESGYDVIACFYAAKHYQVMVLCKEPIYEYYCNSCTVAEIDEAKKVVRFVDLDLDLLVDKGRSVRVVDRFEFEENSERFGYPAELRERVETDLEELGRQVRLNRGVFSAHFNFPKRSGAREK